MITIEYLLFVVSILVLISITITKFSENIGLPALLLFLGIGMIAGNEGLGWIHFQDIELAQSIGIVALIFILFAGGLDTNWRAVKPIFWQGVSLASMGVLLTALMVGVLTSLLFDFSILEGMLLGSIISSTDAAAVFSILRSKRISLSGRLRPLLELESGSNDPMAVFLTVVCIQILTASKPLDMGLVSFFVLQWGLGAGLGWLGGKVMIRLLSHFKFFYEGVYPVFSIAFASFVYTGTALLGGSGFLAIYICGIIVGNSEFEHKRSLLKFLDGLAWLSQIGMFLTLGLLVMPSHLYPVMGTGLLISIFLIFIARPVSVFIGLSLTKLNWREKTLISWVGLRGAVPIVLATFPLMVSIPKGELIFHWVFFIVLTSAVLQGWTIPWVSKYLRVDAPYEKKKRYPIEFDPVEGIDAELVDLMVPFNSGVIGKTVSQIGVPSNSLIVLISRGDRFIVPGGGTTFEGGDSLLVLVNKKDLIRIREILLKQKD